VVAAGVAGDIAELGVWRGGATIYAKAVLRVLGQEAQRKVHVFDAFRSLGGYSSAGQGHPQGGAAAYLAVGEARVRRTFDNYGLLDDGVVFHRGLFSATAPAFRAAHPPGGAASRALAVLRLDGNFYASYQDVLYALYELVPVGGYVIFDDVGTKAKDHGVYRWCARRAACRAARLACSRAAPWPLRLAARAPAAPHVAHARRAACRAAGKISSASSACPSASRTSQRRRPSSGRRSRWPSTVSSTVMRRQSHVGAWARPGSTA
jgi:hypothetical protein